MSVFITGGTGFVGANVARRLVEQGEEVHLLARSSASFWRLEDLKDRLIVHEGDLLDAASVDTAIAEAKPSVVYHLAAYGAYHDQADVQKIFHTAVDGTLNILHAAKRDGVSMVINAGSSSEYGTKDHPMKEDELIEPNSDYAIAKAAQTHMCQHFSRTEGLSVVTLRLFSVYGPYEDSARFMPTIIERALRNEDLPLASPTTPRDFIYIDDVVDAFLAAARKPELSGQIINLGTGIQSSLQDAVETVLALTESASKPLWGTYPPRAFDPTHWVADSSRLQERVGFTPRINLRTGLEKQIAWQREHIAIGQTHAV